MLNISEIEAQARKELDDADFRFKVEARKVALREARNRPWWKRLFPYRIKLERL